MFASGAAAGPMPPFLHLTQFLPDSDRIALLDWVVAARGTFREADVFYGPGGNESRVDPAFRQTLKTSDIGPFEDLFRQRLTTQLPQIMNALGDTRPPPQSIEFELNAYGQGAHFRPHIDIPVGENRRTLGATEGEDRVISAVYYFHGEPKGFSGGALRLYRFGTKACGPAGALNSIAFEPLQNSLLAFPSWAVHSVDPVDCPSGEFKDHRFALNCWFCR